MSFLAFLKRRFNKAFFGSPSTNPVEYIDGRPIIQTTSSDDKEETKVKPILENVSDNLELDSTNSKKTSPKSKKKKSTSSKNCKCGSTSKKKKD